MPITPGSNNVFQAALSPAPATLANPVQWSSSDTTNAPVTADPTDSTKATVAVAASAPVGTSFTLTASYTNPDGNVATGSASFTVTEPDVTSITITQIA